jgi:hypothetical protein
MNLSLKFILPPLSKERSISKACRSTIVAVLISAYTFQVTAITLILNLENLCDKETDHFWKSSPLSHLVVPPEDYPEGLRQDCHI